MVTSVSDYVWFPHLLSKGRLSGRVFLNTLGRTGSHPYVLIIKE